MAKKHQEYPFIDPFSDFAFKRLFGSENSKPILKSFLNELFSGKRIIQEIEYDQNEYPGEIRDEGERSLPHRLA